MALKAGSACGFGVGGFELLEGGHEGLGDVAAAVGSEAAGDGAAALWDGGRIEGCGAHRCLSVGRQKCGANESRDFEGRGSCGSRIN